MFYLTTLLAILARLSSGQIILTDLNDISQHWGQISPYRDNPDDYFGVQDVGLPDGCQIEQAHSLQRHAQRFPTSFYDDGSNDERFGQKVSNFSETQSSEKWSGPLVFLNTYKYTMGEGLLTGVGAITEFTSGVAFWNRYGRTLFNASAGQLSYNSSFPNGTERPKPVLRTTSQSRIQNSQINWSLGFFGPSFLAVSNPSLSNATTAFDVVVIPEGGVENNTLASYDSCIDSDNEPTLDLGDQIANQYLQSYLQNATDRFQKYAPSGFNLTVNDTYAMQSICAYETAYIGQSDFCTLFTADEWSGFENSLDIEYYYDYAYGNPTGRAQGVGYLQELLARLTNQYITSSNSSVNYTMTNNPEDFPLGAKMYSDFSHDDIIVSVLTAMSVDYFKDAPNLDYPPDPARKFILSKMTPFGARLITEVIGCASPDPETVSAARTAYFPEQYGYSPKNATNKFVRMRLNNGILPLNSIRGGDCADRTDGLCSLESFVASQQSATELANYQFACFGNYSVTDIFSRKDYDGTIAA
ncbi:histidine phosphatase [Microthyrium microscopicum]|uniref:Histidine phosphatase n=1 Tax=Microthyrium microscopicum TaxID=703497 RepID=A0A6A6UDT1_9PEZI|nr:histidine phosphatase [Microthyrium microscopicum]